MAIFSVLMVAQSLSMLPLVKDKVTNHHHQNNILSPRTLLTIIHLSPKYHYFVQAFIVMHVVFKILGAKAFQKLSLLHNMASVARKAIYHHFEQITKVLTFNDALSS